MDMLTLSEPVLRSRPTRLAVAAAVVAASVLTSASPAAASVPGNDTVAGATSIALPYFEELDTTDATTDETDARLNEECGAPATDASVWYTFVAQEDQAVEVFVGESDYTAGVIVASGPVEELWLVDCGPEFIFFEAFTGETYYILAFDDQLDGGGNGGWLSISIEAFTIEPPPDIELVVDPVGTFDPTGVATISGSFTCTGSADFIDLFGTLRQPVGRFVVNGFFSIFSGEEHGENGEEPADPLTCDGSTQSWSATVHGDSGLFKGGLAEVDAWILACGFFDCAEQTSTQEVRLRGNRR